MPYFLEILEVGTAISLVGSPRLGDFRVFLVPVLPKGLQGIQSCLLIHGGVDHFQIGHKRVQIHVRHVLAGITQLADDAVLDLGLRKNCVDRCIKPCQIIGTGDEYVFYTSVLQPIQYSFPELGALVFANPHAQDVFTTIQIDSYRNVDCFLHNLSFAADMVVNGIQKYHGVDGFQRPQLPPFDDGQSLVGNPADRAVRDRYAVDVLADAGLVLLHLGLKLALAISRNRHIHCPKAGAKRFTTMAVAAVFRVLVIVSAVS